MAKPYYQQRRLLPSCLALFTALMPLGWCQELRASSSSDRSNASASTRPDAAPKLKLQDQYKNDPFWTSLSDDDRALLENFGFDAADRLYQYASDLEVLLLEMGGKVDQPLPRDDQLARRDNQLKPSPSKLLARMSNRSRALIATYGPHAFSLLNTRSVKHEDAILTLLNQSPHLKDKFGRRIEQLAQRVQQQGNPGQPQGTNEAEIIKLAKQAQALAATRNFSAASTNWEQILKLNEKHYGENHLATAVSLNELATLYSNQGIYDKAKPLYERALAIREKNLSPAHPDIAISLSNLGLLYIRQGTFNKAEPLLKRALAINKKILGSEDSGTSIALNNLAFLYSSQGAYKKAEDLYQLALAIMRKAHGEENPITVLSLHNLASIYSKQGANDKAEPLFKRVLAITEKTAGNNNIETAIALNNLAKIYIEQGLFSKAEPLLKRALAIRERVLGANHPDTATGLNNLALLYNKQGLNRKAKPLLERALSITENALGKQHPRTALGLNNLAELHREQGGYITAESLFLQALAIREKTLGNNHPDTAESLNNLALIYVTNGALNKAEPLFQHALSIYEKSLGIEHPRLAMVLNNLGMLYSGQDAYGKAEPLLQRALAIREKILGGNHPDTAESLNNMALAYSRDGSFDKAESLYQRALAIYEKSLGFEHPRLAMVLGNIGFTYSEQGAYSRAIPYLYKEIVAEVSFFQHEAPFLPVNARNNFIHSDGRMMHEFVFSLPALSDTSADLALFSRLNRHGLLAEIERLQTQLAELPGPEQEIAEELRALKTKLSSITLTPTQRQSLRARHEELEQQLYRLKPEPRPRIADVAAVATALPAGGALVELQKYRPFDSRKPSQQRWGSPRYLALILKPDGRTTAIQLGDAAPIESAIQRALKASAENASDAPQLWARVSELVLQPLAPALAGSRQWFLSPDAELNRVPFAALPAPQAPAQSLAEAVQLRLLTTGRDLLRLQRPAKAGQKPVVMANPSFDRPQGPSRPVLTASAQETEEADRPQQRSSELAASRWEPLSATEQEGRQVASLLGTTAITGPQATTTALQQQQGPRVLHVATHGFFAADQDLPPSDPLRVLQDNNPLLQGFRGEDPQLRSGLVLAGANQPDADPNDDGYLTAAEAVALQLDGTELVVLSACSTGQGEIRTGEGVYGLQRSLTVAGARSTLLSLWKVDDAATAEFMTRFYKRLKAGEGRGDALAATQKEFRDGIPGKPETWKDIYYWGAWQLVGDWRPIQGL